MGEKLCNLFPIPRAISCWDPTVTPCERALETKQEYKRVLQCLFVLLTCTVFTGGKKTSQASAVTESESPSVHEVTTTTSSSGLLLFFFLGPCESLILK